MSVNYVPLHMHTEYSMLDSIMRREDYLRRAKERGYPAVAITEHGNIFNMPSLLELSSSIDIPVIIGMEAYMAPDSMDKKKYKKGELHRYHLVLYAMNDIGYNNLVRLASLAYTRGFYRNPRIDYELLTQYSEGLVCSTACIAGPISKNIELGNIDAALEWNAKLLDLFGDKLLYEMMDHGIEIESTINNFLLEHFDHNKIIYTNDAHYLNPDDAFAHDVVLCIRTKKKLSDIKRLKFEGSNYHFCTIDEIRSLGVDDRYINNTTQILEWFEGYNIDKSLKMPRIYGDTMSQIRDKCTRRLFELGLNNDEYVDRLDYELSVIEKLGFSDYFMIVADIAEYARCNNIYMSYGRGSAAGSLVVWLLGITNLDPIKHNMLFERFLNEDRVSPPDIDCDYERDRRQELLQYIRDKYNGAFQIGSFNRLHLKSALRRIGTVLGIQSTVINKYIADIPMHDYDIDEFVADTMLFHKFASVNAEWPVLVTKLAGLPINLTVHAAGIVLGGGDSNIPVAKTSQSIEVTQYDMNDIEKIGYVKFDVLGLTSMDIIHKTVDYVKRTRNIDIDIYNLPLDDRDTYDLLSSGKTFGVFQMESAGFRDMLKMFKPSEFKHIVAACALYRPGPMNSGQTDFYIQGRHGAQVQYIHPDLESILSDTYGQMIYQEQIMMVGRTMAGYTASEADVLRKAVGKKDEDLLLAQEDKFIAGCINNGYTKELAVKIFELIKPAARYSWNYSHSVSYGMLAYTMAYLKVHYTTEFICAMLNYSSSGSKDRMGQILEDAMLFDIKIQAPDINVSEKDFTVDNDIILIGLSGVKGVGEKSIDAIISERESNGLFSSYVDFHNRIPKVRCNATVKRALIYAGCFDSIGDMNRREMIYYVDNETTTRLDDFTPDYKIQCESQVLPYCISTGYDGVTSISNILQLSDGTIVSFSGIIVDTKIITFGNGDNIISLFVQDNTGTLRAQVVPRNYDKHAAYIKKGAHLYFIGVIKTSKNNRRYVNLMTIRAMEKPRHAVAARIECDNMVEMIEAIGACEDAGLKFNTSEKLWGAHDSKYIINVDGYIDSSTILKLSRFKTIYTYE